MRTFVIGDVHGCLTALETVVDAIDLKLEDKLIFLGDYVDRGPDSKGVVDFILSLHDQCELVCLKGNHEQLMELACETRMDRLMWTNVGGLATMISYGVTNPSDIPENHWDFYSTLDHYHETETHIFVHGGPVPELPMHEQEEETLLWLRTNDLRPHSSGKIVVCGHTPTDDFDILDMGHALCVDTHAFAGGWLTALEIESGCYWQANEDGEVQQLEMKSTKVS